MSIWFRLAACLLLLAQLCACTPRAKPPLLDEGEVTEETRAQKMLVIRDRAEKYDLMYRVSWRVRAANAELCGPRVAYGVGLLFRQLDEYHKDTRDLVRETLGIEYRPTVFLSPPGSPGYEAGLRRGDVIVTVDNIKVERKKDAYAAIKDAIENRRDIPMEYERAGERKSVVLKAAPVCNYPVLMNSNPQVNALASGKDIIIYVGMLKFVKNDDELAGVVAHELAHNTGRHVRDKLVNAAIGRLLVDLPIGILTGMNTNVGAQLGGMAFSQEYEFEADYVGQYYAARAGYDMRAVAGFWRRIAVENPASITTAYTHPTTGARFVRLEAAAAEIDAKRKAGMPLRPEMKDDPFAQAASAKQPASGGQPAPERVVVTPSRPVEGETAGGGQLHDAASGAAGQIGPSVQADSVE